MSDLHHLLGKAIPVTPDKIEELEQAIMEFSEIFNYKLRKHVNDKDRTTGIATPKAHKMMSHVVDHVKWWGLSGLISEQSVENFHQLYKQFFPLVAHIHGPQQMMTLERRLANKNILFRPSL